MKYEVYRKVYRTMKLATFLLMAALVQASATGYSQQVTLKGKNLSVTDIFREIEQQTGYVFLYNSKDIRGTGRVHVHVSDLPLNDALARCLAAFPLTYRIIDSEQTILVKRKGNTSTVPPEEPIPVSQTLVRGTVTDTTGLPLPGVAVQLKGTNQGTATDMEGRYVLENLPEGAILVFSLMGYKTVETPVNNRQEVNLVLHEDLARLDEVVVVGYGTVQKSDLTGSVGTVDEEALQERPAATIQQSMAGRIAGVNVSQNSGRPGGQAMIRIRGNSSITGTNDPLYVVDGIILNVANLANGTSPIDYLEPANIKSIEVLKDASATAIYGARGANGVILVTTKRGSRSGGMVTYDGYLTVGRLARKVDLLNAQEFLRVEEIAYQNAGKYGLGAVTPDPKAKRTDPRLFDADGNPLYDTDWQEEGFQTAFSHNHQLTFSGGDANNSYAVNLGYRNEDGILLTSSLERYSGRLVVDTRVNNWMTAGGSINYSNQHESHPQAVGTGGISPTRSVLQALPITPVRYPDGSFAKTLDYPGMEGGDHPVRLVHETSRLLEGTNMLGSAYANFKLAEGLELRTTGGVNIIQQQVKSKAGRDLQFISDNGQAAISDERYTSWQFENYLTYRTSFTGNDSFTGLLGASWQRVSRFGSSVTAEDFLDDYFGYNNMGVAANPRPPVSDASAYSMNSYFARINYSIQQKYLFTLTGRMDGSSRFGAANRYAFFPSVAAGWRLTEERFMQAIAPVADIKLRSSYGVTGNSEIPNYSMVTGLGSYSYIFNNQRITGIGVARMANPNLKWERNNQFDLGIEVGLFKGRVLLEADLYQRKSNGMLLNAPVPTTSGYASVVQNVGSMKNTGVELALHTLNINQAEFSWNTSFNISTNRNKVLHLTGGQDIVQGTNPVTGLRIIREGEPVNSFYGFIQRGTWGTAQADEAARYNRLPGDIRYEDINNDGAINEQDRVIIGNGEPDWYDSLINSISYKNFELTLDLQFMYGNDVSFDTRGTSLDRVGITNVLSDVLNAWTPENQNTSIPEIRPVSAYLDRQSSSERIYDGSFLRGRNLLLSYDLPSAWIGRIGGRQFRIYASIQNFFLISSYPGYDPEVSSSGGNFSQGLDLYSYPKARTFQLGLSFGL